MTSAETTLQRSWKLIALEVIGLATLTTALFLSDDFLQQLYTANNQAELEPEYVFVLWGLNLCLWLCGRRWFINLCLVLFATMQLLQLSHISYIGAPLTPFDISKIYSEQEEIGLVVHHAFADHWPVFLAWGIPYGALFLVFNWSMRRLALPISWIAVIVVVLIVGSKPHRATYRDMIAFMPGPTRSSLHNSINAFSYYMVRMAGPSQALDRPDYRPYSISTVPVPDQPEHIFLVISDSVRNDRLGFAGYGRDTTPRLSALEAAGELQVAQGLAASVATGSALPLILNVVQEPGNVSEMERGTTNLFRRAREAGYKPFWISTQESKLLNGVGSRFIDVRITKEDHQLELGLNGDKAVLDWLQEQPWGEKNFVVLNLRTTHKPYEENYQSEAEKYEIWPTNDRVPYNERLSNAYDNALAYLDDVLAGTIGYARQRFAGDVLWVFTSDHGQMLGEGGVWGHNRLTPQVASVPMALFQKRDGAQDEPYKLPDSDFISHYEMGRWLLETMGYRLTNPNAIADIHYFHSDKLYENNLFVKVLETPDELLFCRMTLLSHENSSTRCGEQRIRWTDSQKPATPG